MTHKVELLDVDKASVNLANIISETPLNYSARLSEIYQANIYLKREDLQPVRSYKIRGSYNLMSKIAQKSKIKEVVTASAGNHAQGVALSAANLKIKAVIFMPITTPLQKISRVKHFGKKWVDIRIVGANFDISCDAAVDYAKKRGAAFVHPFDDVDIITGQATIALEIVEKLKGSIDMVVCPVGGGGLISGISSYMKQVSPKTEIVAVEPEGAAAFNESLRKGKVVKLKELDTFVDGVAVKKVGNITFDISKKLVSKSLVVPVGKVCSTMIDLYQNEGIIAEPAGALSISVLDELAKKIKGKTVVCIVSGGNNDILRYPEILEKSLIYEGLKHYFLIEFAQKPGQLRAFVNKALGPDDDIVRFEYAQKTEKEKGSALVGIQLERKADYPKLLSRLDKIGLNYTVLSENEQLYSYLI